MPPSQSVHLLPRSKPFSEVRIKPQSVLHKAALVERIQDAIDEIINNVNKREAADVVVIRLPLERPNVAAFA